jgi:hypothetical protein
VVGRDAESLHVLFPVPLLWRDQIPLSFRVWSEPEGHVDSVVLRRRESGHLLAALTLTGLKQGAKFTLRWESLVLVLPHEETPIPKGIPLPLKEVDEAAAPWLASTWCAPAEAEEIAALAASIRMAGDTADVAIPATLKAMAKIVREAKDPYKDLTAVSALTRQGSCTSCANLGAALLRAHGIPARIVAGYPTWSGPLQTHYVVEYWLPKVGWRVMESTRCTDDRPGWEQIQVAMVLPGDEAEAKAGLRAGAAAGVPWLSLTEYPDAAKGTPVSVWLVGDLAGRAVGCDHQARTVAVFEAEDARWAEARKRLSARWKDRTEAVLENPEKIEELAPPEGLAESRTLEALLQVLE